MSDEYGHDPTITNTTTTTQQVVPSSTPRARLPLPAATARSVTDRPPQNATKSSPRLQPSSHPTPILDIRCSYPGSLEPSQRTRSHKRTTRLRQRYCRSSPACTILTSPSDSPGVASWNSSRRHPVRVNVVSRHCPWHGAHCDWSGLPLPCRSACRFRRRRES